MLKFAPYSYSRLNTHTQCPRKFKYTYIDKLPREETDKTALYKGSALHSSLENYPEPGTHKLSSQYQPIIDKFLKSKYKSYLDIPHISELGIGLTEKLEPCEYSKNAMFRGFIDYFCIINDENGVKMVIMDWKSGKNKEHRYQDFNQLMFYAIYMFKKYTKLNTIEIKYVYIEHDNDNSIVLQRKYLDNYSKTLLQTIKDTELSNFEKCKSRLCDYCPYQKYCLNDEN
jgi:CRISPR/Cas system-associated exonuclease Cas4 (RecB family)